MNPPDKIYLVKTTRIIDEWRMAPNPLCGNYEYVCKDAFLEKAEQWLSEIDNGTVITDINAFIESFKQYMTE